MPKDPYEGRRQQLINELDDHRKGGWDKADLGQEVRRRYEATMKSLTDLDGVQTQQALLNSQAQLIEAQQDAASAQRAETERLERNRHERETQAFWSRRFLTNLTVAHAAGAFASITALLRTPPPVATLGQVTWVLCSFVGGLALMGALPLAHAIPMPDYGNKKCFGFTPSGIISALVAAVSTTLLAVGVMLTIKVALQTFDADEGFLEVPPSVAAADVINCPDGKLSRYCNQTMLQPKTPAP